MVSLFLRGSFILGVVIMSLSLIGIVMAAINSLNLTTGFTFITVFGISVYVVFSAICTTILIFSRR